MARDATKSPAQQRLTADRIVGAARAIARVDGIDAVSMRRLAEDLDVWPMSVYRYFRDKDELLGAVVSDAVADVPAPDPSLPWRDQLTALATATHAALEPGDLAARLPEAALTPGVLALSATGVSILTEAGFSPDEASRAWHLLLGFACSRPLSADARAFEYGLERVLDGLEQRLGALAT
jgi:TetR/AcrR family tetracycline transcriptional repressor